MFQLHMYGIQSINTQRDLQWNILELRPGTAPKVHVFLSLQCNPPETQPQNIELS